MESYFFLKIKKIHGGNKVKRMEINLRELVTTFNVFFTVYSVLQLISFPRTF